MTDESSSEDPTSSSSREEESPSTREVNKKKKTKRRSSSSSSPKKKKKKGQSKRDSATSVAESGGEALKNDENTKSKRRSSSKKKTKKNKERHVSTESTTTDTLVEENKTKKKKKRKSSIKRTSHTSSSTTATSAASQPRTSILKNSRTTSRGQGYDEDESPSSSLSSNDPSSSSSCFGFGWWKSVPPAQDAMELNTILQNHSKRIARNPCTYLWVSLIISLALSFIALIVGDFSVSAETGGWQSRGTLIADRQTQLMLTTAYQEYLFYGGEEAWEDLIQNVQPGFESEDDEEDEVDDEQNKNTTRRLLQPRHSSSSLQSLLSYPSTHSKNSDMEQQSEQHKPERKLPFAWTPELTRRLQESSNASALSGCDLSFYDSAIMTYIPRLWPTWSLTTNDPSSTALEPSILRDLCIAEENTQAFLEQEGLCFGGCDNGHCLPPYSLVFYARMALDDGFSLTCDEIADAWGNLQTTTEESWQECVETLKETYTPNEDALPDNCPFGFYPTLVQANFDETAKTIYTSTIFATNESVVDDLYLNSDAFDRGSGQIEGAYDTQYEDFINIYLDDSLGRDMSLALGSAVVVSVAIMIHTRSPLITGVGLLQIVLSFPLSYFIYKLIAGLDFFPFLNFIGIFVVFALGAGDIFVAIDKWKNARISFPGHTYSTEYVAAVALPDAASAMFLTTITTAIAFFATAICPVAPIKMFAIFCGLLILFDYIMNVLLVFPALCIYDKAMMAREKKRNRHGCGNSCWMCCVSWSCCGLCSMRKGHHMHDLEEGLDDGVTASRFIKTQSREFELAQEEEARAKASFIQKVMLGFYGILHKLRWILFVICVASFGVCVYYATTLELPTSSDVRLLNSDHEYEKSFEWRQYLLSEQLEKLSGSTAYIIWGVSPADTGDQNNPASWTQLVLDGTFDPSSESAQNYLRLFCDDLFAQDFASPVDDEYVCPMVGFEDWLGEQSVAETPEEGYIEHCGGASTLPIPQANFNPCMSHWASSAEETSVLSRNGVVKVITIPFSSRVRYDSFFDVLDDEWNLIEDWMNTENGQAPEGVENAYFSSYDFWWYDTNRAMLSTAYSAAAIALGCSAAVILFSSRSVVLMLFSTLTIGFILTSVTAILVAIGWTLGFLESICFAILIGVSVDFVIHFSHAYSNKHGEINRMDRTKYALVKMGPSSK